MPPTIVDISTLYRKVGHLLQQGLRTSTYKLATLSALVDYAAAQNVSATDTLVVPLDDLARRVFAMYWIQTEPFGCIRLRQSTQSTSRIFHGIDGVRLAAGGQSDMALAEAVRLAPSAYQRAIDSIVLVLAQQPLPRLQRIPGAARSINLLFDDSFLHDNVTRNELAKHNYAIKLHAGIAAGLTKLQVQLQTLTRSIWVDDVVRLNKLSAEQREDVSNHLFGTRELLKAPTGCLGHADASTSSTVSAREKPSPTAVDEPIRPTTAETSRWGEAVGPDLEEIAALCELRANGCWVASSNAPVRCRPAGDTRSSMDLPKNSLHRWAWLIANRLSDRNVPPFLIQIRRHCEEKACCNPAHLYPAAPGGSELSPEQVDALLGRSFVTNAPLLQIDKAARTTSTPQTVLTEDLSELANLCTIGPLECWISPTTQTLPCRASGDLRALGDLPRLSTHRWAWMVANNRAQNPLPGDLFQVWKRCTNYRCCNPAHLYLTGPNGKECSSDEAELQLQTMNWTKPAVQPLITDAVIKPTASGGRHRAAETTAQTLEGAEAPGQRFLAERLNDLIAARSELSEDADSKIATSLQQDGLAVSEIVITRLRSGLGPLPSAQTIEAIAYYFNVDTDYFSAAVSEEEQPPDPDPTLKSGLKRYGSTTPSAGNQTAQFDRARLAELITALSESIVECLEEDRPDVERARRLAGWIAELSASIKSASDATSVEMNLVQQIVDDTRWHLHDRHAQEPHQPAQPTSPGDQSNSPASVQAAAHRSSSPEQIAGHWTRETFIDAVRIPSDRAFLLRVLELLDENFALPPLGSHTPLFFGKRPNGAVFVYPFGLRHPPFHFGINSDGRLTIRGCWRGFPKVAGHYGFGELARLLRQDEFGPSQNVPVLGLVAEEVWKVGVRVARAINR